MQNYYGNMTFDGLHEYAYNANGRLIGVDSAVSYEYDALGRLAISTSGSVSTYYYYDTAGRVIAEYSTSDDGLNMTLQQTYIWGSGFNEILAMDEGTSRKYMLTDALGSVTAVYDETTAAVSYTTYDAYGNSDTAPASPYGYAGMRYAAEFDGYITPNRAYSSRTGRWLQPDPLGVTPNPQTGNSYSPLKQYTDGANIYAYVNNNPVNGKDITGLTTMIIRIPPWLPKMISPDNLSIPLISYIDWEFIRREEDFENRPNVPLVLPPTPCINFSSAMIYREKLIDVYEYSTSSTTIDKTIIDGLRLTETKIESFEGEYVDYKCCNHEWKEYDVSPAGTYKDSVKSYYKGTRKTVDIFVDILLPSIPDKRDEMMF